MRVTDIASPVADRLRAARLVEIHTGERKGSAVVVAGKQYAHMVLFLFLPSPPQPLVWGDLTAVT
jgi:hypothetical protein